MGKVRALPILSVIAGLSLPAVGLADPPVATKATAEPPARNPKWHRCDGEHAPDAPRFGKRIALTFDDGPSVKFTPRVLKILRKHKVPATFFVVGRRLRSKRARTLVAEIHADPLFLVGNHSWSHPHLDDLPAGEATSEVDKVSAQLTRLGIKPRFFRFPYATTTCATAEMVRKRGYTITGWHIDSADWCYAAGRGHCKKKMWSRIPDPMRANMNALVLARAKQTGGGIVLLHDIHGTTVAQLDALIRLLKAEGFRFVSLDDRQVFPLLNSAGP